MAGGARARDVSRERRAGVLLHPTSLPGSLEQGDIGHEAYRFIEFLAASGIRVWQMLPLGPTHEDRSPYQCLSSHAGNPLLVSLDWLEDRGWLQRDKAGSGCGDSFRYRCLELAADNFYRSAGKEWQQKLDQFCEQHAAWLDDYALFMAFKSCHGNRPWYEWPAAVRHREQSALKKARKELAQEIRRTVFVQFAFFTQWHEIRKYAREHDIELFGDMPIFVARDSADVWAQRDNFLMDSDGNMEVVAGVPPDAFSDTGQRWGNPLYDWHYMQNSGYQWWKDRFVSYLELFDLIRIDHFRGLQACWEIPAKDDTAENGSWEIVPGRELLEELHREFGVLPLIAEDLGVITDEVIELKEHFGLPGMKVLQFAFDGNAGNPHLPHHHREEDVVYAGTHDNDTTLGWLNDESGYNREYLQEYAALTDESAEQRVRALTRMAVSSVAFLSVLTMQDILLLDSAARMNTPGTVKDNWLWRFQWRDVDDDTPQALSRLLTVYQR